MKTWILVAILASLIVIAGIAVTNISTAQEPAKISCSTCAGSCSPDANCGLASCGGVSGGTCGCGR